MNAAKLKDAEFMAAITSSQNKAASDIAVATTFALLLSVDVSDSNAKTTEYLAMNCDEYAHLLKSNESLVRSDKSAYTQSAGLIQHALETHKCRPSIN